MKIWEINKTIYKVSDFIGWQKNNTLSLNPSFQRRSVWKKGAKSFLLDTIIRGLPIPIIFLRERRTDITKLEPLREVVDGQQRLRTLISFIAPNLLSDYDVNRDQFSISKTHNADFSGKAFRDLPIEIQQQILDYQFSVHVLPSNTDDKEILQIFGRMNSTGLKLNPQELRNAEFFGEFKTSVYESALKYLDTWKYWGIFTNDNIARMQEVELCSDLYILMINGITSKSQNNIDSMYENFDLDFPVRNIVEHRFEIIMEIIQDNLNDFIATSIYKNTSLFYPLFAAIYDKIYGIGSKLKRASQNKLSQKQIDGLKNASTQISNNTANQKILDAASTRRASNLAQRKTLSTYLIKQMK